MPSPSLLLIRLLLIVLPETPGSLILANPR